MKGTEINADQIARSNDWNGVAVAELLLDSLTGCNFHKECQAMRMAFLVTNALDELVEHFIMALLWVGVEDRTDLDEEYLSEDAKKKIKDICRKFLALVSKEYIPLHETIEDIQQIGHDLFMTIQGHGVGFWELDNRNDEKYDEIVNDHFGTISDSPYFGDDGKIYFL